MKFPLLSCYSVFPITCSVLFLVLKVDGVQIIPVSVNLSVSLSVNLNLKLVLGSLTGRILNVESQEMKFHEWGGGVDPDESCWVECVKFNLSFLVVIRVFYEVGPPSYEEIGEV